MGSLSWTLLFVGNSFFCWWIVHKGGAEWMEGWKSLFFIDWFYSFTWSAEQIKFYVVLWWLAHLIWFIGGLFNSQWRFIF